MRSFLCALFLFGSAGTLAELVLLEHTEDYWQKLPLALLALGITAVAASAFRHRVSTIRAVRLLMVLFVLSGGVGLYQHYQGNLEFELEMNASRHGWELAWETLKGATPTLAPGTMLYLGLLGLAYAHLPRPTTSR